MNIKKFSSSAGALAHAVEQAAQDGIEIHAPPIAFVGLLEEGNVKLRQMKGENMTEEMKSHRIANTRGPTYKFTGRSLGFYSTNPDGKKDRWQEVELFETVGGAWVAVLTACSDRGREMDIVMATVIEPGGDELERKFAAMEAMDWTSAARRLAKDLGWKLVKEIE